MYLDCSSFFFFFFLGVQARSKERIEKGFYIQRSLTDDSLYLCDGLYH